MSLTHIEASARMDFTLQRTCKFIHQRGYVYPFLFPMRKGAQVEDLYKDGYVLDVGVEAKSKDPNHVYGNIIMFEDFAQRKDPEYLQSAAQEIVRLTKADAIGFVTKVLMKQFDRSEFTKVAKTYNPKMDPQAMTALYACYYLRQDRKVVQCLIPFIDRGETPSSISDFLQETSAYDKESEDDIRMHDVTIFGTGWFGGSEEVSPMLKWPFGR